MKTKFKCKTVIAILNLLAVIGGFVVLGAIGNMDYMTEIGEIYPLSETIKFILLGILLMVPRFLLTVKE